MKTNKLINTLYLLIFLFLPLFVFAQPGSLSLPLTTVVANIVLIILNVLWIISIVFTVIMFVIAGFKFMTAQGDISKVIEARNAVVWGTAGVIVIILAWSIVSIMRTQIGV